MVVLVERESVTGTFWLDTESVSTKVVSLGLQEVCWEVLCPIAVIEAECCAECRCWDSPEGALANNVSPSWLSLVDGFVEEVIEKKIFKIGVCAVCGCDVLEENRANNAATSPHECNGRLVKFPFVRFSSLCRVNQSIVAVEVGQLTFWISMNP